MVAFQGTHDAQQHFNGAAAPRLWARLGRACRPDAGMNSIMERCIGGCRRELLDRTLIWNRADLRRGDCRLPAPPQRSPSTWRYPAPHRSNRSRRQSSTSTRIGSDAMTASASSTSTRPPHEQHGHTVETAAIVDNYAERTGAMVLAEGIGTETDLETAKAVGAHWGQGWLLVRPARSLRLPVAGYTAAPYCNRPAGSPLAFRRTVQRGGRGPPGAVLAIVRTSTS